MTPTTLKDWTELAQGCVLPDAMWISGKATEAVDGRRLDVYSSVSGRTIGSVPRGAAADVDRAVAVAARCFKDGAWSRSAPEVRAAVLLRAADLIERNADELAALETLDTGKLVREVRESDVPGAAATFRFYATALDKVFGEVAPTGPDDLALVRREPVGVVGAVVPWNFPLETAVWKLAPALALGNSVVLKPAEQSPLTALALARLLQEAGLPDGALNVVTGLGPEAGAALGLHDDVATIAFTGSTAVGRRFLHYASESNMKMVALECGGKSPNLIFPDADLEAAARAATVMFSNQGQVCSAPSRLLVHSSIRKEFVAAVVRCSADITLGNPLDPTSRQGALIDEQHTARVMGFIERASASSRLRTGGEQVTIEGSPCYITPTIFDEVAPDSELNLEEVFGPVLAVSTFDDEEDAISQANASRYGLAASLWTMDLKRAHRVAGRLRAGTVGVNINDALSTSTPFGGFGQSGTGRDLSLHAFDSYSALKTTWVNLR